MSDENTIEIVTLEVGMMGVNCLLVIDSATHDALIVDPGDEAERIIAELTKAGATPRGILLTHGHVDHIGAVNALREKYPSAPLVVGEDDVEMIAEPDQNFSLAFPPPISILDPEIAVLDTTTLDLGSLSVQVEQTPGHTPGSVIYRVGNHLFSGDTLFAGSVGRTDFPGGSWDALETSLITKILPLPDELICYPGHGPATTIERERRTNPFLLELLGPPEKKRKG